MVLVTDDPVDDLRHTAAGRLAEFSILYRLVWGLTATFAVGDLCRHSGKAAEWARSQRKLVMSVLIQRKCVTTIAPSGRVTEAPGRHCSHVYSYTERCARRLVPMKDQSGRLSH